MSSSFVASLPSVIPMKPDFADLAQFPLSFENMLYLVSQVYLICPGLNLGYALPFTCSTLLVTLLRLST